MCERAAASCWKTGSRMAEPGSISGRSWQLSSGLNRGAEGIKLAACGTHDCRHNRWLPVDMPPADASSLRSMKRTIATTFDMRCLAFFDVATRSWKAEPGRFTVLAGSSSADIHARASFALSGTWIDDSPRTGAAASAEAPTAPTPQIVGAINDLETI